MNELLWLHWDFLNEQTRLFFFPLELDKKNQLIRKIKFIIIAKGFVTTWNFWHFDNQETLTLFYLFKFVRAEELIVGEKGSI